MSWVVDYELHVKAEIRSQLKSGSLTKDDLRALSKWVDEIEAHGLDHVQTVAE